MTMIRNLFKGKKKLAAQAENYESSDSGEELNKQLRNAAQEEDHDGKEEEEEDGRNTDNSSGSETQNDAGLSPKSSTGGVRPTRKGRRAIRAEMAEELESEMMHGGVVTGGQTSSVGAARSREGRSNSRERRRTARRPSKENLQKIMQTLMAEAGNGADDGGEIPSTAGDNLDGLILDTSAASSSKPSSPIRIKKPLNDGHSRPSSLRNLDSGSRPSSTRSLGSSDHHPQKPSSFRGRATSKTYGKESAPTRSRSREGLHSETKDNNHSPAGGGEANNKEQGTRRSATRTTREGLVRSSSSDALMKHRRGQSNERPGLRRVGSRENLLAPRVNRPSSKDGRQSKIRSSSRDRRARREAAKEKNGIRALYGSTTTAEGTVQKSDEKVTGSDTTKNVSSNDAESDEISESDPSETKAEASPGTASKTTSDQHRQSSSSSKEPKVEQSRARRGETKERVSHRRSDSADRSRSKRSSSRDDKLRLSSTSSTSGGERERHVARTSSHREDRVHGGSSISGDRERHVGRSSSNREDKLHRNGHTNSSRERVRRRGSRPDLSLEKLKVEENIAEHQGSNLPSSESTSSLDKKNASKITSEDTWSETNVDTVTSLKDIVHDDSISTEKRCGLDSVLNAKNVLDQSGRNHQSEHTRKIEPIDIEGGGSVGGRGSKTLPQSEHSRPIDMQGSGSVNGKGSKKDSNGTEQVAVTRPRPAVIFHTDEEDKPAEPEEETTTADIVIELNPAFALLSHLGLGEPPAAVNVESKTQSEPGEKPKKSLNDSDSSIDYGDDDYQEPIFDEEIKPLKAESSTRTARSLDADSEIANSERIEPEPSADKNFQSLQKNLNENPMEKERHKIAKPESTDTADTSSIDLAGFLGTSYGLSTTPAQDEAFDEQSQSSVESPMVDEISRSSIESPLVASDGEEEDVQKQKDRSKLIKNVFGSSGDRKLGEEHKSGDISEDEGEEADSDPEPTKNLAKFIENAQPDPITEKKSLPPPSLAGDLMQKNTRRGRRVERNRSGNNEAPSSPVGLPPPSLAPPSLVGDQPYRSKRVSRTKGDDSEPARDLPPPSLAGDVPYKGKKVRRRKDSDEAEDNTKNLPPPSLAGDDEVLRRSRKAGKGKDYKLRRVKLERKEEAPSGPSLAPPSLAGDEFRRRVKKGHAGGEEAPRKVTKKEVKKAKKFGKLECDDDSIGDELASAPLGQVVEEVSPRRVSKKEVKKASSFDQLVCDDDSTVDDDILVGEAAPGSEKKDSKFGRGMLIRAKSAADLLGKTSKQLKKATSSRNLFK